MSTLKRKVELLNRITALGFTFDEAQQLRRISLTLSKWAEMECGDDHGRAIERDETTGKPFITYDLGQNGKRGRYAIADREAGALKRLKAILKAQHARCDDPIIHHHQTDPRGCALYLLKLSEIPDGEKRAWLESNYTRGLAVCA